MDDLKSRLHEAQINTQNETLAYLLSEARTRIEMLELELQDSRRSYEEYRSIYGWGKGKDE